MSRLPAMDREPPASPCVKICRIDRQTGWCLGCFRTGEEIGAWPSLDDNAKRALLTRIAVRRHGTG